MSFRLQHASSQQHSASGNHPQTHWNAEAGHPLRHLHAAEQPAVRRPVQPGCRHLPGTSAGMPCRRVCVTSVWLTLWLTQEAVMSFLCHLAISPVMDYLEFPRFVSIRWRTSWRSWPRRCSPCPCWAAGWASTSGSRCSSWWSEWLSCRLEAVFCFVFLQLFVCLYACMKWKNHVFNDLKKPPDAICGSCIWNNNTNRTPQATKCGKS